MIFTTNRNTKVTLNLSLIANIEENENYYIVNSFCDNIYLQKDASSQKLFDWFAAKTEKDMISKQDVDSAIKNSMKQMQDMIANLQAKR